MSLSEAVTYREYYTALQAGTESSPACNAALPLIDFMSPIFPETAKSSHHALTPPAKSFQRKFGNPSCRWGGAKVG